jgi:SAM-dependent methyltransferase
LEAARGDQAAELQATRNGWEDETVSGGEACGASDYGENIAGDYDAFVGLHAPVDPVVEFLHSLVGGVGPALELGGGTGRVAIPLGERGVAVHAPEVSPAMCRELVNKDVQRLVRPVVADMSEFSLDIEFGLIYTVFNSFLFLTSRRAQARCLAAVARHLRADGTFVIEIAIPDFHLNPSLSRVSLTRSADGSPMMDIATIDPVAQLIEANHLLFGPDGIRVVPLTMRYVSLSELDLMAESAGLLLTERCSGWDGSPVTRYSVSAVSVYQPAQGVGSTR